jgi:SAM-dependent methyltransferase
MRYDFVMNTPLSIPTRASSLSEWYRNPLGKLLADVELSALAEQLPGLFGYHLMVVDPPWETCILADSRIPHHIIQRIQRNDDNDTGVVGHTDSWPVMTDTLDAIILPHTLELSVDPHQVLREAERSLIPDGHLVIIGFNPWSLWGVRRLLSWRTQEMPWNARFFSLNRIKDWLSLLGFDTLYCRYLFQRPPIRNSRMLGRLQFLEPSHGNDRMLLAGAYILVARKRTVIMTPLKALRNGRRQLFPVGIPTSSQRNIRRVSRS